MPGTHEPGKLTDFLLRRLPEQEMEELEREFFDNDDRAAELLAAEDALIADYSAGLLDPETKRQFEAVLGSTASQRREIGLVKSLESMLPARHPVRRSATIAALAACAAMFALAAGVLVYQNGMLKQEIRDVRASRSAIPAPRRPDPATRTATPQPASPVETEVPAVLLVAGVRENAAPAPQIQIPSSAAVFILEAEAAASDAFEYRLRLESVEGALLYQADPLKADANSGLIRAPIPANTVRPGDYIVIVQRRSTATGSYTPAGEYYFRVSRP